MARVCVFIRSLTLGGAEKQATLLAHALQAGHEVQVLVLSAAGTSARHLAFLAQHGIATTFLPAGRVRKVIHLRKHLIRERIDALFCFLPSDSVLGAVVARSCGVERIFGGLRNARLKRHKELALRFVHNHVSDFTISNSHAAAEWFARRGFAAQKLLVVPNGIFVGAELPARAADGVVNVMTAARFVEEKEHVLALAALRRVVDAGVPLASLRYLVVGSGPLEASIRARARELGLEQSLEVLIDPGELGPLFARAHVYVSTSRHEGLSNSIMEAMNACLPIVATDVGDNARLVRDRLNGRLVPIGDERALADALHELIRSPELRHRYGAQSHAILAREYSFEAFQRAYARILEGGAHPAPGPLASPSPTPEVR